LQNCSMLVIISFSAFRVNQICQSFAGDCQKNQKCHSKAQQTFS
jgi:hypothetical protein